MSPARFFRDNRFWSALYRTALALVFLGPSMALAQEVTVVRVEEDWALIISSPDAGSSAPQVSCVMSPSGGDESFYAVLELNHQSEPAFVAGGVQLQVWDGETLIASHKGTSDDPLRTDGELVRWTQSMTLAGNLLTVEVTNGQSSTWGDFGGQGYLKHNLTTNLTNLNAYDPSASVANSGVGFASNRVTGLVIERVRYVLSTGLVVEDAEPRVVFAHE